LALASGTLVGALAGVLALLLMSTATTRQATRAMPLASTGGQAPASAWIARRGEIPPDLESESPDADSSAPRPVPGASANLPLEAKARAAPRKPAPALPAAPLAAEPSTSGVEQRLDASLSGPKQVWIE
jgi:hypothetical protein